MPSLLRLTHLYLISNQSHVLYRTELSENDFKFDVRVAYLKMAR